MKELNHEANLSYIMSCKIRVFIYGIDNYFKNLRIYLGIEIWREWDK